MAREPFPATPANGAESRGFTAIIGRIQYTDLALPIVHHVGQGPPVVVSGHAAQGIAMSVFRRMLGRNLPCGVGDLLNLHCPASDSARHERLVRDAGFLPGSDELLNLAFSPLALGQLGRARQVVEQAIELRPASATARLALAVVHERLAEHTEAARQIDSVLCIPS